MMTAAEQRGAHRAPDGRFRNPWPHSEPHPWRAVVAWYRDRRRHPPPPSPPQGSFPTAVPEIVHPRAAPSAFTATWIGHSTVLLQLGGLNLLTDPVFSERAFPVQWMGPRRLMDPALAVEALPPLDLILISHSHYDHLDRPAVRRLAQAHPDASWVVPLGLGRYIRGGEGGGGCRRRSRLQARSERQPCGTLRGHGLWNLPSGPRGAPRCSTVAVIRILRPRCFGCSAICSRSRSCPSV